MPPRITASEQDGQRVFAFEDLACDLSGVIVVDSSALGPATGGCRFWHYNDAESMLVDAKRLARGMSYKNAMARLPLGGGKSVIRRPQGPFYREALFRSFGLILHELQGEYLAAEDVGTTPHDMATVRSVTPFVFGLPSNGTSAGGDPSPWTARGVFLCIEHMLSRRAIPLAESRIAVQGLGSVGAELCRRLHERGATLVVADVNEQAVERLITDVRADVVPATTVHRSKVDLFAPCALGAGLNHETIPEIQASLVVGAANNQLASPADDDRLHARGILYAPDYIANAGGIINVAAEYLGNDQRAVLDQIERIPDRLAAVLDRSEATGRSPSQVADAMARDLIEAAGVAASTQSMDGRQPASTYCP